MTEKGGEAQMKLDYIIDYNKHMKGVEMADQ